MNPYTSFIPPVNPPPGWGIKFFWRVDLIFLLKVVIKIPANQ